MIGYLVVFYDLFCFNSVFYHPCFMFYMTYLVLCVVIFRHLLCGLMFNFLLDFIVFLFPSF